MRILKQFSRAVCAVVALTNVVNAGEKEDALIGKVVAAYGGKNLTSAKALTFNDQYKNFRVGQGYSAGEVDVELENTSLTIDFENKRKNLVTWRKISRGNFLSEYIHDGEAGHFLDHSTKTHSVNPNRDYNTVGGRIMRRIDTALVHLLSDATAETKYLGESIYRGKAHEKLSFKMAGGPELTLAFDKETGLLSRATQQSRHLGELTYVYSEHRKQDGITYASDTNLLVEGRPNVITRSRTIEVNSDLSHTFDLPSDYAAPGAWIDTSKMTVKKLADDVYFAGLNGAYSVFVDAGDHYVGVGGYAGLSGRLKTVQELAGNEKPLRDQILTHHHSDHLGGVNEVAELGANFVTVDANVEIIRDLLTSDVDDRRFIRVNNKQTFGNGKVEVYDITTAHAEHYLLYYVPSAKLVFSADHFFTDQETALPSAHNNMVTFRQAIEDLGIDVERFASAHAVRTLTIEELHAATDGYTEDACPEGLSVCNN